MISSLIIHRIFKSGGKFFVEKFFKGEKKGVGKMNLFPFYTHATPLFLRGNHSRAVSLRWKSHEFSKPAEVWLLEYFIALDGGH